MFFQLLVTFLSCRLKVSSCVETSQSKTIALESDTNGDFMVNNVDFLGIKAQDAFEAATNVNYFFNYAFIAEQKKMLSDHVRMRAYHSAIFENKDYFKGKVVLDVGAGSGVLAMWCAQAGAAHVYAVEYTDIAKQARELVRRNNLSDVVTVIQSSIEDFQLDVQVDAIVSEWMGLLLLRESMVDSVLLARDRFLKPGGTMWPSHASLQWGLVSSEKDRLEGEDELEAATESFDSFAESMQKEYGLDYSSWQQAYALENERAYVYQAIWKVLEPHETIGEAATLGQWDLLTATVADMKGVESAFEVEVPSLILSDDPDGGVIRTPPSLPLSGFAGWFSVHFKGSPAHPVKSPVELSTAPSEGYTHWAQEVCFLRHSVSLKAGDVIRGSMTMNRRRDNKRMYNIGVQFAVNEDPAYGPFVYELQ